MQIYLAARYSRREELVGYRARLAEIGHVVQARWLDGSHQISDSGAPIGDRGEALVEGDAGGATPEATQLRAKFAYEDIEDVLACDLLIAFTEPPRSGHSRGGRHVELGIAIGAGKRVWVVGHRENIFCWSPRVVFLPCWEAVVEMALRVYEPINDFGDWLFELARLTRRAECSWLVDVGRNELRAAYLMGQSPQEYLDDELESIAS